MKAFFDFEQYSDAWWAARRGIPTASEFHRVITPKKGELAAAHRAYICKLIGDTYGTTYPNIDKAVNAHMQEGTRREPESRRWYEFAVLEASQKVQQVGFCTTDDGRFGCSPDGLVNGDGLLQLKNPSPEVHVGYILDDVLPCDYLPQCYGELYVTGRQWLDFVSYCPGLPPFCKRITPEGPFYRSLRSVLDEFHGRFTEALAKFKGAA